MSFLISCKITSTFSSTLSEGTVILAFRSPIKTAIPALAYDITHLIGVRSIIHAIIGVSQGGAAVLAFSSLPAFFPFTSLPSPLPKTKTIIACDTSARTPAGNKTAWEEHASLAHGTKISFDDYPPSSTTLDDEFATHLGMSRLASITIPR
ncbi:hypothetical protein APHAL10511_007980 [Amanita phalloides]|nr:hypothetical protein APHAL10511_007980 [Amanita phalloides]